MPEQTFTELVAYLPALHGLAPFDRPTRDRLANYEMRALNHEHIFALPLRADNGLDLDTYTSTPGLVMAASSLKEDTDYTSIVAELGERYRHGTDGSLLHGGFFPGSFLLTTAAFG